MTVAFKLEPPLDQQKRRGRSHPARRQAGCAGCRAADVRGMASIVSRISHRLCWSTGRGKRYRCRTRCTSPCGKR